MQVMLRVNKNFIEIKKEVAPNIWFSHISVGVAVNDLEREYELLKFIVVDWDDTIQLSNKMNY